MKKLEQLMERLRNIYTEKAEEINGTEIADSVMQAIYGDRLYNRETKPLFSNWTITAAAAALIALAGTNAVYLSRLVDSIIYASIRELFNPLSLNDLASIVLF